MTASNRERDTYAMGRSEAETERLIRQARMLDLPLRRRFEDAGIVPGMRVLDIGGGAGDVAMTAAEFVGPSGAVVGLDMTPSILETARARARSAGLANVSFVATDMTSGVALEGPFDAIVGRAILVYLDNP